MSHTVSRVGSYRIKFVMMPGSLSGIGCPPFFRLFSTHTMLSPKVRIVCNPSASCEASPGRRPCTLFQYWELTTGMSFIVKYLFNRSNVALAPPRRQYAIANRCTQSSSSCPYKESIQVHPKNCRRFLYWRIGSLPLRQVPKSAMKTGCQDRHT